MKELRFNEIPSNHNLKLRVFKITILTNIVLILIEHNLSSLSNLFLFLPIFFFPLFQYALVVQHFQSFLLIDADYYCEILPLSLSHTPSLFFFSHLPIFYFLFNLYLFPLIFFLLSFFVLPLLIFRIYNSFILRFLFYLSLIFYIISLSIFSTIVLF